MTMTRKLGRQPRTFRSDLPHYSVLRMAAPQAPLPASVDWLSAMPDNLSFMLNDRLGDCPIAGGHHARQVWSINAGGAMVTDPDKDVLSDYESFCGYVQGDPSTDQGGILQNVLVDAVNTGWSTENGPDKLLAFYELDVRNFDDIKRAIAEAGVAYIGIDIPEAWSQSQAGDTWDVTDSPVEGGHCVILAGYDEYAFEVISWGLRFRMTFAGFQQACSEAYALIDRTFITKRGLTPAGLTADQLETAMAAIKETV